MSHRLSYNLVALAGSFIANTLLVGGLLLLNASTIPNKNEPDPMQFRIVREHRPTILSEQAAPELSKPAEPENQPIHVNLDFDPPLLQTLHLPDLPISRDSLAMGLPPIDKDQIRQTESRKFDVSLMLISSPQPIYPAAAERSQVEGWVKIKMYINKEGRVDQVDTLSLQGHESFQAAVETAVMQWAFHPPTSKGKTIRVTATKTFYFEISDEK